VLDFGFKRPQRRSFREKLGGTEMHRKGVFMAIAGWVKMGIEQG
jgi:hypothetical protein